MMSKSDREVLEDRLHNWGRWATDSTPPGTSWLWRAIKKHGKRGKNEPLPEAPEAPPPVDELDALLVERAWVSMPESPKERKRYKQTLRYHYCFPKKKPSKVAKELGFSSRRYDEMLKTGQDEIAKVLYRFDKLRELQQNDSNNLKPV